MDSMPASHAGSLEFKVKLQNYQFYEASMHLIHSVINSDPRCVTVSMQHCYPGDLGLIPR